MHATFYPPRFLLIDCNNFFASCERIFRPDLEGKPVIVLSNNDGCVIARSNEAKALGIAMGEPFFRIKPFAEARHIAVFSSNFSLYRDISHRVMDTVESVVGREVEQYSIDECFVPLTPSLAANVADVAISLRETVRRHVNIPVSIGIGSTRTLAKLACYVAKKKVSGNVYDIGGDAGERERLFADIPVDEVWGIGRRKGKKLRMVGIRTVRDFVRSDEDWIKRFLTVTGYHTLMELRGIPLITDVVRGAEERKSIVVSRSFGEKIRSREELVKALSTFVSKACVQLRQSGLVAGDMTLYFESSRFGENVVRKEWQTRFMRPTNDTRTMVHEVIRGLSAVYEQGPRYARGGVLLCSLQREGEVCGNLLFLDREEEDARQKKLMRVLDAVNRKYTGNASLRYAVLGGRDAQWHMRQERLSGFGKEGWNNLPVAKCR
ncbi:MAG: Y-family DNA polymerase [Desulfovibrio sp.]|nr:Y-family DNA polymerase [Desulfovibrio sp.]